VSRKKLKWQIMSERRQVGLISRLFARKSERPEPQSVNLEPEALAPEGCANNATRSVRVLVEELLREPSVLIVTGYQDFLSTLTILLETVEDLHQRPPGSIRIVFGTNTETSRGIGGAGQPVLQRLARVFPQLRRPGGPGAADAATAPVA
jgi:hypothetical protein